MGREHRQSCTVHMKKTLSVISRIELNYTTTTEILGTAKINLK